MTGKFKNQVVQMLAASMIYYCGGALCASAQTSSGPLKVATLVPEGRHRFRR